MQVITNEITAVAISKNDGPVFTNPNDVTFLVHYSEGYKGPRFLEEGSTQVMSKEVAEDFEKRGIGKVVTGEEESPAPVTEPPATEPPVTEPPVTEPPVTEPPVTEPPVTEPPATEPPVTEPPVTEPPATEPPVTEPPVTEPPVTEPPVTEPPAEVTLPEQATAPVSELEETPEVASEVVSEVASIEAPAAEEPVVTNVVEEKKSAKGKKDKEK